MEFNYFVRSTGTLPGTVFLCPQTTPQNTEKKTPQPFYFSVHDHMFYYKLCSKLLILYFKRMGLFRSEVCLIPGKPHVNELNHD